MKTASTNYQQSLIQWVSQVTGINTFGVKIRLLGNDLHILCEGRESPWKWQTLTDLLQALQQTDLESLTDSEQSPIYQVFVYGRKKGEYRPQWCHRVYLNQLEKHIEHVQSALLLDTTKTRQTSGALIISNESLARQGHPDAIARYLSESLSNLGIAIKVQISQYQSKHPDSPPVNRCWVFCQSSYSPDAGFLAESIAQKLRHLQLTGFDDAAIALQIRGEIAPEWRLRVDLTPPEIMLKEWARWGDVQAIAKLLNEALSELKVVVRVSPKESTLHIFCSPASDPLKVPDKQLCLPIIVSQLELIAPQGILAATIYGVKAGDNQPIWIDWLSLPATLHPDLAIPTLELASSGDEPAITFLLERLINSDLDWRLKTGGTRVLLLRKGDLLHVMCDAPVCPARGQVASKVMQFIRQLKITGMIGVRVYGRRAGDKEPVWHQGLDFYQRPRLVPEATPEFAATAKYVDTLMTLETQDSALRPELTTQEVQGLVNQVTEKCKATIGNRMRELLLGSQLFTEINQSDRPCFADHKWQNGLIWVCLGIMLTLQSDWILGFVTSRMKPNSATSVATIPASSAPLQRKATPNAILLAARSPFPSFNARQLDEQLALYKERLATNGHPPDILIVGSSRALRGVDPLALSRALTKLGDRHQNNQNIDVFNFGINGATTQVINFIVSKLLETGELPKIILWGDGSRAFNDGRDDITFNAIAASKGYAQVLSQAQTASTKQKTQSPLLSLNQPEINSYQATNQWLNQALAKLSGSYQHRDLIKTLLGRQLNHLPLIAQLDPNQLRTSAKNNPEEEDLEQEVDINGFLPLSIRFNPTLYFQKHPRVPGSYDSDYSNFQLGGKQDNAFRSILEFTKMHKITLIFVNMPLTGEYLDPIRRKYEAQFQQYMLAAATKNHDFIYRDLSQAWLTTNDYFSDPSHLNRYGAYEVSQKLAQDPMIPWQIK